MKLLYVGLIQIQLGGGLGYLRVAENPHLLAFGQEALDLVKLLQFDN